MSKIVFDNDFEEWWSLNYSNLDKKGYLTLVGKGIKEIAYKTWCEGKQSFKCCSKEI